MDDATQTLPANKQDDVLYADGFDGALIGHGMQHGMEGEVAIYSMQKAIALFAKENDVSHEEAQEFIEFNCSGAYVGPKTPIWMWEVE